MQKNDCDEVRRNEKTCESREKQRMMEIVHQREGSDDVMTTNKQIQGKM